MEIIPAELDIHGISVGVLAHGEPSIIVTLEAPQTIAVGVFANGLSKGWYNAQRNENDPAKFRILEATQA